jgi:hypothetical protein
MLGGHIQFVRVPRSLTKSMLNHCVADGKEFVCDEMERRREKHACAPHGCSYRQTSRRS